MRPVFVDRSLRFLTSPQPRVRRPSSRTPDPWPVGTRRCSTVAGLPELRRTRALRHWRSSTSSSLPGAATLPLVRPRSKRMCELKDIHEKFERWTPRSQHPSNAAGLDAAFNAFDAPSAKHRHLPARVGGTRPCLIAFDGRYATPRSIWLGSSLSCAWCGPCCSRLAARTIA
jgi:hypothetical protein